MVSAWVSFTTALCRTSSFFFSALLRHDRLCYDTFSLHFFGATVHVKETQAETKALLRGAARPHRLSILAILLSGLCFHSSDSGCGPSFIVDGSSSESESSSPFRLRRVDVPGVETGEAVFAAASAERVAR